MQKANAFELANYQKFVVQSALMLDYLHTNFPIPVAMTMSLVSPSDSPRPEIPSLPEWIQAPDDVKVKKLGVKANILLAFERRNGRTAKELEELRASGVLQAGDKFDPVKAREFMGHLVQLEFEQYKEAQASYDDWSSNWSAGEEFFNATRDWLSAEGLIRSEDDRYVLTSAAFARGYKDAKAKIVGDIASRADIVNPTIWDEVTAYAKQFRADPARALVNALPAVKVVVGLFVPVSGRD
jgi:hypothetical protein